MADEDAIYDEVEIEDCFYDETLQIYHHPCPCGDRFEISISDMRDGEDIARCPSCSLQIRIIFDAVGSIVACHSLALLTLVSLIYLRRSLKHPKPLRPLLRRETLALRVIRRNRYDICITAHWGSFAFLELWNRLSWVLGRFKKSILGFFRLLRHV